MKQFQLVLNGTYSTIRAESFQQTNDYVSFYEDKKCVGLVRLGTSDLVVEVPTKPSESGDTGKARRCPDCGYAPYERGDAVAKKQNV